jgi:hypothetical protein
VDLDLAADEVLFLSARYLGLCKDLERADEGGVAVKGEVDAAEFASPKGFADLEGAEERCVCASSEVRERIKGVEMRRFADWSMVISSME